MFSGDLGAGLLLSGFRLCLFWVWFIMFLYDLCYQECECQGAYVDWLRFRLSCHHWDI